MWERVLGLGDNIFPIQKPTGLEKLWEDIIKKMDCKITNMSENNFEQNTEQEEEILAKLAKIRIKREKRCNADEIISFRDVDQDLPWIVEDIEEINTKIGPSKIITFYWKGKTIRTWGCNKLNKELADLWTKKEDHSTVQIVFNGMKQSKRTRYKYHDFCNF